MTMPVMVSISTYHNNYILLKPIDINECSTGDHLCEQVCVNSIGSYDCECFTGFQLDTNLLNCSGNPIPAQIVVIIIIFTDMIVIMVDAIILVIMRLAHFTVNAMMDIC